LDRRLALDRPRTMHVPPLSPTRLSSTSGLSHHVGKVFAFYALCVFADATRFLIVTELASTLVEYLRAFGTFMVVGFGACIVHLIQSWLWPLQPQSLHFTRAFLTAQGAVFGVEAYQSQEYPAYNAASVGVIVCFLLAAVSFAHWFLDVRSRAQHRSCAIMACKVIAFYTILVVAWTPSCIGLTSFDPQPESENKAFGHGLMLVLPWLYFCASCVVHLILGLKWPLQPHSLHFSRAFVEGQGFFIILESTYSSTEYLWRDGVTTCIMLAVWTFSHWYLDVRGAMQPGSETPSASVPDIAELHLANPRSDMTLAPAQPMPVCSDSVPVATPYQPSLLSLEEQCHLEEQSLLKDQDLGQ